VRLVTFPGVFRPRSDSWLLAECVDEQMPVGASVLDLFTGSGILAIAAAAAGARAVTAVDISRRSLLCATLNARINGVQIRTRRGDMFAAVKGARFDLIMANPPYLPSDGGAPRGAARAWDGGVDGRAFIDRFCLLAPAYLGRGGRILLMHSSVCGIDATLELLSASGLQAKTLRRVRGPFGPLLAARAPMLERRGLLDHDQREEELVVIGAKLRKKTLRPRGAGAGPDAEASGVSVRVQAGRGHDHAV
jgi:release factor glutamine methyltransferase